MNPKNIIHQLSPEDGHPVSTDLYNDYGWHPEILTKFQELINYATARHNKVFYMTFTVTFPHYFQCPPDNHHFICFISKLMTYLKRQGLNPLYLWTRENTPSSLASNYGVDNPRHHYHVSLFLNGSITQNRINHLRKAEALWSSTLNLPQGNHGLIDDCTSSNGTSHPNGIMLRRNSPDFQSCLAQLYLSASYACKAYTKGEAPKGIREYGSSEIPRSY